MTTGQLPLFEGTAPNGTRLIVSGSLDSENYPSTGRALHLGEEVTFMARGRVTQVNHAVVGKEGDTTERRHMVVLTSVRFDEAPLPGDDDWEQSARS